ncbi:MAG: prolyl oligopeptidase family serine peptidase [Rickettsiales bacterium]|nr:prolyl oligopeptidase family serine peptidase [Rickettsiales bacterium]
MIESTPFIPHTLAHLTEAKVFPSPLPEAAYSKMLAEYAALDVITSRITYDSQGLRVTGLSALPATIQKQSHPILIYNRGGSHEYGKLTVISVLRSMAPFARAGFLVYASNYRGADGGEGSEDFGGEDVQDVLQLIEAAKQNPAWDGKNIFMLGHSRGGMMTCLAMKHGAQLSAAIILASLTDLWQAAEQNAAVDALYHRLIPELSADREAMLKARSPVYWPEQISAPLYLLHSQSDDVVPAQHSLQLADALTKQKKPHNLHLYSDANHALLRVWDDVLARSLSWFGEHHA